MNQRKPAETSSEFASGAHARLEEVVGYRGGDLSPERMAAVERHLVDCAACRDRLAAAEAVLATVDWIAEQPFVAESAEIELLLERLKLAHEAAWRGRQRAQARLSRRRSNSRGRLGIRSPQGGNVVKVAAMAKGKRQPASVSGPRSETEAAYALWEKGDLKSARAAARALLAKSLGEAERAKLERLIRDTSPDRRAFQVGVFCLSVVVFVLLLTKFFG